MNLSDETNRNSGFTLIEAIVASVVFALVVTSIIGVYMSVLRLDSKSRAQRSVADNTRYIMDFLGKEIRNGHIDYSRYPLVDLGSGPVPDVSVGLYLVNQSGESEFIRCQPDNAFPCNLELTKGGQTSTLHTSDVELTSFDLIITPQDPFVRANNFNYQPTVTINMEMTSKNGTSDRQVKLRTQTTVTERYYPPKQ